MHYYWNQTINKSININFVFNVLKLIFYSSIKIDQLNLNDPVLVIFIFCTFCLYSNFPYSESVALFCTASFYFIYTKTGWSNIILYTHNIVLIKPHAEYNILVTNEWPGNFSFLTNITILNNIIAPSIYYILTSILCFR